MFVDHLMQELRTTIQVFLRDQLSEICETLQNCVTSEDVTGTFQKAHGSSIRVKPSSIVHPDAGMGAWIQGSANVGQIIALFPGVVYSQNHHRKIPGYPSLGKTGDFLMARFDGNIIDARAWMEYKNLDVLENERSQLLCGLERNNPLAVGHMINHPPTDGSPNVIPAAFDLTIDEGMDKRKMLPVVQYTDETVEERHQVVSISGIAFVALRQMKDEEVFVDYRLNPTVLGGIPKWYHPVNDDENSRRWS